MMDNNFEVTKDIKAIATLASRYTRCKEFDVDKEGITNIAFPVKEFDETQYETNITFRTDNDDENEAEFIFDPTQGSTVYVYWDLTKKFHDRIVSGTVRVGSKSGASEIFMNAISVRLARGLGDRAFFEDEETGKHISICDAGNGVAFFEDGICIARFDSYDTKCMTPKEILEETWYGDYFFGKKSLEDILIGII